MALAFWTLPINADPIAVRSGIKIERLGTAPQTSVRLGWDSTLKRICYLTMYDGLFAVHPADTSGATDFLIANASQIGMSLAQGLVFRDSAVFISGVDMDDTTITGIVSRGDLQSNLTASRFARMTVSDHRVGKTLTPAIHIALFKDPP